MTTIGDSISRMRNVLKAVKEDPFITDRYIFSVIRKYARFLIRRQDNESKVMRTQSVFQQVPCIDLIEVDKIEACCGGLTSHCKIMRTKDKLPLIFEGTYGPIIRSVSSVDDSMQLVMTYPSTYIAMSNTTNFKYNKAKYYWFINGYLYFPNIEWEQIKVDALWDADVSTLTCEAEDDCKLVQDQSMHIPDYLFAEIEQLALKEFLTTGQLPTDGPDDKQNVLR
jgi:hypothetical protein